MRYTQRPLSIEARARLKGVVPRRAQFSATWTQTLKLLESELTLLVGRKNGYTYSTDIDWVLQIDVYERDLRLDGQLRAGARPQSPAVAIAIESAKTGPLLFVCGEYLDWGDNVRAIALTLELLRAVDRYGVTKSSEQYLGFNALPPGTPKPAAKMTLDEAAEFLAWTAGPLFSRERIARGEDLEQAFRHAARKHHPDGGGDPALFRKVTEARDLILQVVRS